MRLICPNCGAQYEVPDHVIPAAGRDVQCSNCGHTWFETPGASVAAEEGQAPPVLPASAQEAARKAEPENPGLTTSNRGSEDYDEDEDEAPRAAPSIDADPDKTVVPVASPAAGAAQLPAPPPDPVEENDPTDAIAALVRGDSALPRVAAAAGAAAGAAGASMPQRRGLDPSVTDILREEAAREENRRRGEPDPLEDQTELGIDGPADPDAQRAEEARRRLARLKGENPLPQQQATRRERLPDIDQINSTLRATSERENSDYIEDAETAPARRRGFRSGFRLVLALALIGLGVYAFAPRIATAVPALAPTLDRYVAAVDEGRLWLDGKMRGLLESMTNGGEAAPVETVQPQAQPLTTAEPAPAVDGTAPATPEAPDSN